MKCSQAAGTPNMSFWPYQHPSLKVLFNGDESVSHFSYKLVPSNQVLLRALRSFCVLLPFKLKIKDLTPQPPYCLKVLLAAERSPVTCGPFCVLCGITSAFFADVSNVKNKDLTPHPSTFSPLTKTGLIFIIKKAQGYFSRRGYILYLSAEFVVSCQGLTLEPSSYGP